MATKHSQPCPIARFLNVFGDAWTLLVIREALAGVTRFSEFQRNTGIARNLLSTRLASLCEDGIMERIDVGQSGTRYAYRLTGKGRSIAPVFLSMIQWSSEHLFRPGRHTLELVERASGETLTAPVPRTADGRELSWDEVDVVPGPGMHRTPPAKAG